MSAPSASVRGWRGAHKSAVPRNQYLRAGLIDELSIHLVPVLFGAGTRLIDALPEHTQLEPLENLDSPSAAHLRYRVVRQD